MNDIPTSATMMSWRAEPLAFSTTLTKTKESKTLVGQALLALLNSDHKDYNNCVGRKLAMQVASEKTAIDLNLYAMFLIAWIVTADKGKNLIEAEMIIKKLIAINRKGLYPETQATILSAIGYHKGSKGNKLLRRTYFEKALKTKGLNLAHKEKILVDYASFISASGMRKDLQSQLVKIKEEQLQPYLLINKYADAIQLCNLKESKNMLYLIKKNKKADKLYLNNFDQHKKDELYIHLISEPGNNSNVNSALDQGDQNKVFYSCHYLYLNNPMKGLDWSRRLAREHPITMFHRNISSYSLIRAELANKNFEASEKLLSNKTDQGDPHFLDDFFYARIAILKDNIEQAKKHISKLHNACQYYDAFNRLNFELELSCELDMRHAYLFIKPNSSFKNKTKNQSIVKQKEVPQESTNTFIGKSDAIKTIKKQMVRVAKSKGIVLLTGETGVGKEVVAKAIHDHSSRSDLPYLPINCGAISESLLQSELFGHVAGAFTGADQYQSGIFEAAQKGTVFLDEIGEVTPAIQIALLRVLENKEVKPIGSNHAIKITCHIIAATNKDLESLIQKGSFREDLFYRLNQLNIIIPPLRERSEDIPLLINHFLAHGRSDDLQPKMSDELLQLMTTHHWPGNVRQLKNEIEKMRLLNSEKLFYKNEDSTLKVSAKQKDVGSAPKLAFIQNEKAPIRRRERILELFNAMLTLTRGEIIKSLNYAPGTVTKDLKILTEEGHITRVEPSASTRTHYFEIKKGK